jgi:hypothetical protein
MKILNRNNSPEIFVDILEENKEMGNKALQELICN